MRLINTSTGQLEEFIGSQIPKYAILSHTWEDDEVSFKDLNEGIYKHKKGFIKIAKTCELAAASGLKYAWVDTCSIDKSSSAELTEAINSMYQWYQRAEVCYAFLSDLPENADLGEQLPRCRWFTRGWTLQELIAPTTFYFLDQDWHNIGSKVDLAELAAEITGIDVTILQATHDPLHLAHIPVAVKMSWAAHRVTTRPEDAAYCLLGIFNLNMPLLYGEEEKSFRRLQEEIVRSTADLSIFGWSMPPKNHKYERNQRTLCGILADSPAAFLGCGRYRSPFYRDPVDFSMSNNGVKLKGHILFQELPGTSHCQYILPLQCKNFASGRPVGVQLKKVGPEQYLRENPWEVVEYNAISSPKTSLEQYLLTKTSASGGSYTDSYESLATIMYRVRRRVLQIKLPPELDLYGAWPLARFDHEDHLFFISGEPYGDFGSLRVQGSFVFEFEEREVKVALDIMFYAVGWGIFERDGQDASMLQCTVFDYRSHAALVSELQFGIAHWDHDSRYVLDQLSHHDIPKCFRVVQEISETPCAAVVSFIPSIISDPTVCRNPFWRIEFSCDVVKMKDIPAVVEESWNLV